MKTKQTSKKVTYTATFEDGTVVYAKRPQGNLVGELPLGTRPDIFGQNGDPWDGASGVTPSGRVITIRRD